MGQEIRIPGCTYFGRNSKESLRDIIAQEKAKYILVVADQGIVQSGIATAVTEILKTLEVEWRLQDSAKTEPSYMEVEEQLEEIKEFPCNLIVAVGGGSVMDAAKLYSVLKGAEYSISDLLEGKAQAKKLVKTVMIPTTCGTGAEATCNAIVAIPKEHVKKGIVSQSMIPDYVILDSEMIAKLPSKMVAATGIDALAHAVECYTSNKATVMSNLYAAEAAKLIFTNIRKAYDTEGNTKERQAMLLGAYYGGIAITGSGTTAVHALSYPLGGKYHIPHGVSNAILFAHVMRMNKEMCKKELALLCDYVWPQKGQMYEEDKAEFVIREIERIVAYTKIPTDLTEFGVACEDIEFLVQAGSRQKRLLNNNKKRLTEDEIRTIYKKVLK